MELRREGVLGRSVRRAGLHGESQGAQDVQAGRLIDVADNEHDASRLLGYRSDGRDWPAGRSSMTLDEIFAALDAITPEISIAAQQSLEALDRKRAPEPQGS